MAEQLCLSAWTRKHVFLCIKAMALPCFPCINCATVSILRNSSFLRSFPLAPLSFLHWRPFSTQPVTPLPFQAVRSKDGAGARSGWKEPNKGREKPSSLTPLHGPATCKCGACLLWNLNMENHKDRKSPYLTLPLFRESLSINYPRLCQTGLFLNLDKGQIETAESLCS